MSVVPTPVAAMSEAQVKATIDQYIVANPLDFRGIDELVFKYRGEHISVRAAGVSGELTADQAADRVTAADVGGGVVPMSGVPMPQLYITKLTISGGVQFWGTWDFPDSWAGQGSPVDIAAIIVSVSTCARTQNQAIWTYRAPDNPPGGSTNLGSLREHAPDRYVMWNVADYTTNFLSQADRGTTRLEVVRTSACSGQKNVGASFTYEANRGGAIGSISLVLGLPISVSYSIAPAVEGHWGTDAIWQMI